MERSLRSVAFEKYKVNPFAFICLGVFFCIFASMCVALSLLVPFLGTVAIVLLAIPLLFGIIIQVSSVEYFERIEFKNIIAFSLGFYRPQFSGSLRLLTSLLKSFLINILVYVIAVVIAGVVAHNTQATLFDEAFLTLRNAVASNDFNVEQLQNILQMNGGILMHVQNIGICAGLLAFYFAFLFQLFYNTLGIYFRTMLKPTALMFGRYSINNAIKANRGKIFKDYFYLNWPLFLLGIAGATVGVLISIYVIKNYTLSPEFGLMGALLFMAIYFPMYLANMNALFDKYKYIIILGVNNSIKETIQKIQSNIDLSEEDRQRIEDTLKECDEDLKEMEEENKKDSDDQNP